MYTKFLSLSREKQDKIINSALKVFSKTSYNKASTDEITKDAEISKGSLFHYFRNKKNLYLYLYDYATNTLLKEFYEKIDLSDTDIFNRLKNITIIKINLMKSYPDIFNFMLNSVYDTSYNFKSDIEIKNEDIGKKNIDIIFKDVDKSKFRDDIDINIALEMIFLVFEAYGKRESYIIKDNGVDDKLFDIWLNKLNFYIDTMKKIYYKGECL